jgi:hypothetical protein
VLHCTIGFYERSAADRFPRSTWALAHSASGLVRGTNDGCSLLHSVAFFIVSSKASFFLGACATTRASVPKRCRLPPPSWLQDTHLAIDDPSHSDVCPPRQCQPAHNRLSSASPLDLAQNSHCYREDKAPDDVGVERKASNLHVRRRGPRGRVREVEGRFGFNIVEMTIQVH